MENTKEELSRELLDEIAKLPEDEQAAIAWLIRNHHFAVKMCKAKKLSPERRKEMIEKALIKNDSLMLALVMLEKHING